MMLTLCGGLTTSMNAYKIVKIINFIYGYFSIILTVTYIDIQPDISMFSFYVFLF